MERRRSAKCRWPPGACLTGSAAQPNTAEWCHWETARGNGTCPEPWVKGRVILALPIDSGDPWPRETRLGMTMVGGPDFAWSQLTGSASHLRVHELQRCLSIERL